MDFLSFIDKHFASLFIPIGTIFGAVLGSYITSKTQKSVMSQQIKWEKEKRKIDKLEKLTDVYNLILKVDGENRVIDYNQGRKQELQEAIYIKYVRPVLYEKFHLLHSDIAKMIKEIDDILLTWSILEEESYDGESEHAASLYFSIIDKINQYIDSLRLDQD